MATRKSASKPSKKSAKKKAGAKAGAAKKKATAKKKPAKKSAAKATAKTTTKATTATKATAKTAARATAKKATQAAAKPAEASEPPKKKSAGKFSSADVNMGHVFALRPRVNTSFRQPDFISARQQLKEDGFESAQEAARAVAEKAIEMTHGGSLRATVKRGRH